MANRGNNRERQRQAIEDGLIRLIDRARAGLPASGSMSPEPNPNSTLDLRVPIADLLAYKYRMEAA